MKATTKRLLALVLVLCTMLALGMRTVPYAQAAEELPEGIVYGARTKPLLCPPVIPMSLKMRMEWAIRMRRKGTCIFLSVS